MCCLSMGLWLHVSNVIFVCINTYLIIADCSFIRMRQSYLYNLLYPVHVWRRFAYYYFLSYRRVGECVVVGLRIRMAVYVVNGALYRCCIAEHSRLLWYIALWGRWYKTCWSLFQDNSVLVYGPNFLWSELLDFRA